MLAVQDIRSGLQEAQTLRQVFATVSASSCPKYLNFHLHTIFSDGKLLPTDLVDQALAMGIKHFAITDHHSLGGYFVARDYLQTLGAPHQSQLWVGVEINASLLFTEVHILGYAFDPYHPAIQPYVQGKPTAGLDYQALNVIQAIHTAGGLAVLAHPARYRRTPEELIPAAAAIGLDGVETYYGYDNSDPWMPSIKQTEQICILAKQYGLFSTCGTDSHGYKITRRL
ncbi:MAG: PHP domain-containing protein [Pseudanabaenaceae cyanobacterium]